MKKNYSILLFLCLFGVKALAFNLDALKDSVSILESGGNDIENVNRLNQYAARLIEARELEVAETAATHAYETAKLKDFKHGLSDALDNLGLVAQGHADFSNAMNYFIESVKIKDAEGDKPGNGASKSLIGRVFFLQHDETRALVNFQSALNILESSGDQYHIAQTHQYLGDLYLGQKLYGKATSEFEAAMHLYADNNHINKAAAVAAYLGKIVTDMGDYDGAITYYNSSLNFHRNLSDTSACVSDMIGLAKVYGQLHDKELALENAQQALRTCEQTGNKLGVAESAVLIGQLHLKNNEKEPALQSFGQGASALKTIAYQAGVPELYKALSEGYKEMNDYQNAYAYQNLYSVSKDSLFNQQKSTALLDLTTKYESEYSVKDKNRQLANIEKERSREKMLSYLVLGLLGMALFTAFNFYRNYRRKQADNENLQALNLQIQQQHEDLKEKNENILKQSAIIDANYHTLEQTHLELQEKNASLDLLNEKLIHEIGEREFSEKTLFSKDHFLANVAYKLRAPLNEIVGLSSMLMDKEPRADQKEPISRLQFAANNIVVLINDVLDFSKIEAGKLTLDSVGFNVREVLDDVRKSIISTDDVSLSYTIDPRLNQTLLGDPIRLKQVMNYLLTNVQKSVRKGAIATSVSLNEMVDNEQTLKIELDLTGTQEIIENHAEWLHCFKVFQPDFNKDEAISQSDMELLIAKRLIELQNGEAPVLTAKDDSASFVFFLSFKMTNAVDGVQPKTAKVFHENGAKQHYPSLAGKRILIAEDNKINQLLVSRMLNAEGAITKGVNDGLDALDEIVMNAYDLVLMDIQMPRMDGYRAVSEIRKMNDKAKREIPIIALTASTYLNEKEKAQLFGMTDYIGKPFSPEELLEKVSRVFAPEVLDLEAQLKGLSEALLV